MIKEKEPNLVKKVTRSLSEIHLPGELQRIEKINSFKKLNSENIKK